VIQRNFAAAARRRILAGALLLAGCGGGATDTSPPPPPPPPPPAPVVTTVEVTPAGGPLFVTDTLQLTAAVKDQNGAVMTGKTVTWSSSNQALASVSATGLVIGVGAGSVTISALAEGKTGTAQLTVTDPGPRITTEASTSASGTIGVEGGSITTTSTGGVAYTLIVPAGALPGPVLIHMTPVTAVRKFPLSGGLVGGVEFQPSGLEFAQPARLRVAILQRPAAGMRLLGLTGDGDATVLLPQPAIDSGTVASLPIRHFSHGLVGFGTIADVNTLLANTGGVSTAGLFYANQLLAFSTAGTQNSPAAVQVMRDWFANVILPLFQHAASDADLVAAINEFNFWNLDSPVVINMIAPSSDTTTYAAELALLKPVAADKIGGAIDGNNVVCSNQQSFSALANVLFWQTQAQALGVATVAFNLDRAAILTALCAHVVLESSVLPDPMDVGTPYSLDATFGLQFQANGSPQGAPFGVTLTAAALSIAHPTGATDISGFYTTVVSPTAPGPVQVTARGCLILPGTTAPSDVCGTGTVHSNGRGACGRVVAGILSIRSDADVLANADVKQAGGVSISGAITVPVNLSCLTTINGDLRVSGGLPSLSLPNVGAIGGLFEVFGTSNLVALSWGSLTVAGDIEIDNNAKLANIQLGQIHGTGNIEIDGNAKLASFQLGAINVTGDVEIDHNPLLTTFQIQGGTVGDHVEIDSNDALASFGLGAISIGDHLEIDNNAQLVTLLASSGSVGANLEIDHNASLSNQAAQAWAAGFAVVGQVLVNNNHNP
jgi:hypothetical protein